MKRKTLTSAILVAITLLLTGCCISHDWQEATCTAPQTCSKCGKTEGEALGHTWVEATCSEPKHCEICGETEGEALPHTWVEATCSEPKHCEVCGATEGEPLEHTLTEANYQQPATCEVCGETVGEPLQAEFEKYGFECNAQLDTPYSYTVFCKDNIHTTEATVTLSDYEVFESDNELELESIDGYEYKSVTMTALYDDDNVRDYGLNFHYGSADYYNSEQLYGESAYNEDTGCFTLNYNGIDYPECGYYELNLQEDWDDTYNYTLQDRIIWRVPKGYDGIVYFVYEPENDSSYPLDRIGEGKDTIFFRFK